MSAPAPVPASETSSSGSGPVGNFSAVSPLDTIAHACSRPGYPSSPASIDSVNQWTSTLHSCGIRAVLSMLGDDEVEEVYKQAGIDIDAIMRENFDIYARTSVYKDGAKDVIVKFCQDVMEKSEDFKFTTHCAGGAGRAGLAAAVWVLLKHEKNPAQVKEIVEAYANEKEAKRKVDVAKVEYLISNGSLIGFKKE